MNFFFKSTRYKGNNIRTITYYISHLISLDPQIKFRRVWTHNLALFLFIIGIYRYKQSRRSREVLYFMKCRFEGRLCRRFFFRQNVASSKWQSTMFRSSIYDFNLLVQLSFRYGNLKTLLYSCKVYALHTSCSVLYHSIGKLRGPFRRNPHPLLHLIYSQHKEQHQFCVAGSYLRHLYHSIYHPGKEFYKTLRAPVTLHKKDKCSFKNKW